MVASYQELMDSLELGCVEETERVLRSSQYSSSTEVSYHGLKCMGMRHSALSQLDSKQLQECVTQQLKTLSRVRHPNILQFLGVCGGSAMEPPLLVYEHLPLTLAECLSKCAPLPLSMSLTILKDVAQALCCLHHHSIAHGHISTNSVYLARDMSAKLGDIEVTFIPSSVQSLSARPTLPADTHLYGLLMQTLLDLPLEDPAPTSSLAADSAPLKQTLGSLMHQCLHPDPRHRPDAPTLLACVEGAVSSLPGESVCPLDVFLRRRRRNLPSVDSAMSSFEQDRSSPSTGSVGTMSPLMRIDEGSSPDLLVDEEALIRRRAEIESRSHLRRQSTITELQLGTIEWTRCADIPVAMFQAQSTLINGHVYVGGGNTASEDVDGVVYEYDPAVDSWRSLPPAPHTVFGVGQLEGELVIVGGRSGVQVSDLTMVFDRFTQRWKFSLPPLLTPRHSPTCLCIEGALIVSGGLTQSQHIATSIEVMKAKEFEWNVVGYLSRSSTLCYPSPTTVKDCFYLLGGYTSDTACSVTCSTHYAKTTPLLSSKTFNPYIWRRLPDTPHSQPTAGSMGGYLLSLGGSTAPYSGTVHSSVHAYCPFLNSWEYIGELPQAVCHATAVPLPGNELLLIGGWVEPGKFKRSNAVHRGKFVRGKKPH